MPHTPIDKRNFYLSLSIAEGQKIASSAGFSVPSTEVQESEIMDIISKWVILASMGIFETTQNCAEWMLEVVKVHNDLTESELENTKNVILSFGMALVSHLVDNDMLLLPERVGGSLVKEDSSAIFSFLTFATEDDDDEEEDYEDE
jgi:hypothetical protein